MHSKVAYGLGMAALLALASACSGKHDAPVKIQPRAVNSAPAAAVPAAAPPALPVAAGATSAVAAAQRADQALMAQLMLFIFTEGYDSGSADALVQFQDDSQSGAMPAWVVTPIAAKTMPDGVTVLVTSADLAGRDQQAMHAHPNPGHLGVYLLKPSGSSWTLLARHDDVAELGEWGQIGRVEWVQLGAGKPGFAVIQEYMNMGYGKELLSLFDPRAEHLRDLSGESIALRADNTGACGPRTAQCWDVKGTWQMGAQQPQRPPQPSQPPQPYDDIVMDFSGQISVGDPAQATNDMTDLERTVRKVKLQARYAYDGQRYRLVWGRNPVPLAD